MILDINIPQESKRAMQEQQQDTEKQKTNIPMPEIFDFKIKAAEIKSFAKVSWRFPYFYITLLSLGVMKLPLLLLEYLTCTFFKKLT